jgi:hypothetical protein
MEWFVINVQEVLLEMAKAAEELKSVMTALVLSKILLFCEKYINYKLKLISVVSNAEIRIKVQSADNALQVMKETEEFVI